MARESEPKRHHSRLDRESSPKRSRRNGKPTIERSPNRLSPVRDKDDDRKHRRRLHDPLPLEKQHASDSKHDDRSNAGQDGTSTERARKSERGSWRSHEEDDRRGKHLTSSDALEKAEKSIAPGDDRRHKEPSKANGEPQQPTKKKFREEKLPITESQPAEKDAPEPVNKREERGNHRHPDRYERDRAYGGGGRFLLNRARPDRGGFSSRDRYRDGIDATRFRGRDGYMGRQDYRAPAPGGGGGARVDKWKHDMFDEVNKSPSKNEDPVAKAEALLA